MKLLLALLLLCFIFTCSLRFSHQRGLIDDPNNFTLVPEDVQTSANLSSNNESVLVEEPIHFRTYHSDFGDTDFIRLEDSKSSSRSKSQHNLQFTKFTKVQELDMAEPASGSRRRRERGRPRMERHHLIDQKKRNRNRLSPVNIYIASTTLEKYSVEVQDKGEMKHIQVSIGKEVVSTVSLNTKYFMNHSPHLGFVVSTENLTQLNDMLNWEFVASIPHNHIKETKNRKKMIVAACGLGFALLITSAAVARYYFSVIKRVYGIISLECKYFLGAPKKFKFQELKNSTNNFDENQKLGEGGAGAVYKGILHKQNLEVAIRMILTNGKINSKSDFLAELLVLHRLRHKHLVPFHGWCYKKGMLLLAYEYMPNGSLDKHLFGDPDTVLSWTYRYNILKGIASALRYLHKRNKEKVVHGNLKSSNIMLDTELNAHLGDFGLPAVLGHEKATHIDSEGVYSTFGYTALECILTGKAGRASDVYAFGAILLEVTCGRRPWMKIGRFRCLVNWVWSLYRKGQILAAVDFKLANNFVAEEAERILLLGLACSRPVAKDRPKSHELLEINLGNIPTPDVPHFKQPATSLRLELQRTKH